MIPLVVQLGLASIYKSYPSLADAALYMALVPIFSGLAPCKSSRHEQFQWWFTIATGSAAWPRKRPIHFVLSGSWLNVTLDMSKKVLVVGFLVANAALGPVFWHAWIIDRSANANFFFATTLVYGTAHTLLLIDIVQAYRKFDFVNRHPRLKLKAVELL